MLVVGSVALDTVETPFGRAEEVIGGSAVYFSAAASLLGPVRVVGVVGTDYPREELGFLVRRGVDLEGLQEADGPSFRWGGRYDYDLNARETLFTELGVFADFRARIPEGFREAEWIFLGNIDPALQHDVLDQIRAPRLVACDTMNYWIEREREALVDLLSRIDVLMVNDAEVRELADDHNLARAAGWVLDRGPDWVVVKKGEHGAILFGRDACFFSPGYPLEEVFDPTGAGDAFAGGVVGSLARAGRVTEEVLRRAVVFGCAAGSFACEEFGPARFRGLTDADLADRVRSFREMTRFDPEAGQVGVAEAEATS
jgi:sugar/nucleoside kinase (ribokinase family)